MSDSENPNTPINETEETVEEQTVVVDAPVNFDNLPEEEKKKQQLKLITYLVGQKIQILNNMLKQKGLESPLEDTEEKFKSFGLVKNIERYLTVLKILQGEVDRSDIPSFLQEPLKRLYKIVLNNYNKFFSPYIRRRLATNGIRNFSLKKYNLDL